MERFRYRIRDTFIHGLVSYKRRTVIDPFPHGFRRLTKALGELRHHGSVVSLHLLQEIGYFALSEASLLQEHGGLVEADLTDRGDRAVREGSGEARAFRKHLDRVGDCRESHRR